MHETEHTVNDPAQLTPGALGDQALPNNCDCDSRCLAGYKKFVESSGMISTCDRTKWLIGRVTTDYKN